jgi:hypothetical protein
MMQLHGRAILVLAFAFSVVFFPIVMFGQRIRIADMSMSPVGASQRMYSAFSAAVARFDVVAAYDVMDAGGMEKVLAGMDEGWEAAVSKRGYFGFIYRDRVQMVKELGNYPGKGEFARIPYGAQFRLAGTRFALNLVICQIEVNKDQRARAMEIAHLAGVYRYFENLTGNHGITLLIAGGLGSERELASRSLAAARGDVVALRASSTGAKGLHDEEERMFASAALRARIEEAGIGSSTPNSSYVILKTGK